MHQTTKHQELSSLLKEYSHGVDPNSISLVPHSNPNNQDRDRDDGEILPDVQLCLLEMIWLRIRLDDSGFRVVEFWEHGSRDMGKVDSRPLPTSDDADEKKSKVIAKVRDSLNKHFESMDALLDTVSPLYRAKFSGALFEKLKGLATEANEGDQYSD